MKILINWIKRMIELIQGTTSTPSDDVRRQEIPSRLAIEKGMYPDEAVTVAQIAGGNGMQVKQTNGNTMDIDGNIVTDLKARGNLIINRNQLDIKIGIVAEMLPNYLHINMTSELMEKAFGTLKEKAVLIINGVQYSYEVSEYANANWFTIGVYSINGYDQLAIKWLGNDKFQIEVTDSIFLRI